MSDSERWPSNELAEITFDADLCRTSFNEFSAFLSDNLELDELDQVQPFFREHPQLAALLGALNPNLGLPDRLAFELSLIGKFKADVVIGNAASKHFVLVEFEDAKQNSIFRTGAGRSTSYWSYRFEQGYSQIVDWFHLLNDIRPTRQIREIFGADSISFMAVLVVGRRHFLSLDEADRLEWRRENVVINSKHVLCLTYDELLESLRNQIRMRLP